MAQPFTNMYHRRAVAGSAAKPCSICYKPTSTVLNQADSKDWFYICPGHLTDKGFATAVIDAEAEAAKKRKEALDAEIELVKKEYEEKMKRKGKDKKKDASKKIKDDDAPAEEEKDPEERLKELESQKEKTAVDEGPRVFELQKAVYQMRVQRLRNQQQNAQMQQRRKDPNFFPSVPTGGV